MGSDIKSLRIRIRSVDSTLHLTKAMGLVAASKIRRATRTMNQSREYAFECEFSTSMAGNWKVCVRMFPKNDLLPHRQDFCYVKWLD